jgi:hypothetical protein
MSANVPGTRRLLSHPLTALLLSLAGAVAYGAWATWRFTGDTLSSQLVYVVPIVVPFVAFLFDRAKELRTASFAVLAIDALVVATSILRARGYVPLVSGHALFLTYAVLRPGSLVTRITAAVVMIEVIYLKLFVWHDFITPTAGIALALIAALIIRRFRNGRSAERKTEPAP